jgi:hypothetical protein
MCNIPTTFQKVVPQIFRKYFNDIMQVFLDIFVSMDKRKSIWIISRNVQLNIKIMALVLIQKNVHFVSTLKYY